MVTSCTLSLRLLPGEAAAAPPKLQLLLRLAEALGLSGQLEASLDALTDALPLVPEGWPALRARTIASVATLERLLGRYPLARADFTEAHRWALQAVTGARDHDTPLYAAALSLIARTTALHGDAQLASALLAEARAVLDGLPDAGLTARLETAADDDARELEGARVLIAEMGVPRLYAEMVRRPRGLARRIPSPHPGSPALAGLSGLTTREREVAGLVAQGYSNRQIAEQLVMSVRTVTTHISHIFAKLGVSSRAAIAAAWAHSPSRTDG